MEQEKIYDVAIIGAGPAGLSAAIYASRANLKTLIIESMMPGGKLTKTYEIENYPGINKIGGIDLAEQLMEHGLKFGAELEYGEVIKIISDFEYKVVVMNDGNLFKAKTVIIATGTQERQLALEEADKYVGQGISYCAVCDGAFYKNKDVCVIGGGNSALEEALYLSSLVNKINIIIRRDVFRAEASIQKRVEDNSKINVIVNSLPEKLIIENNQIVGLAIKNVQNGIISNIPCSGIFPYIGANPSTSFVDPKILNEKGYIIANNDMSTGIEGIYAAGDCIEKDLRQVVTATSDGAIAANSVIKYLQNKTSN